VALKILHSSLVRLCRTSSRERSKILALPSLGALFAGIETIMPVLEFANHGRNNAAFGVANLRLPFECDRLSPQPHDARLRLACVQRISLASTARASRLQSALSS